MTITSKLIDLISGDSEHHRYEIVTTAEDIGIAYLDNKTKKVYRLDEKTGDLMGIGDDNWKERVKVTKKMDIDTRVPFFRKSGNIISKKTGKKYDVYANVRGDRFIHEKEKGIFIGIDKATKDIILHVKKQSSLPTFGSIPIIHKPIYLGKSKMSEYPYAYVGAGLATFALVEPFAQELSTVNPALSIALMASPTLLGAVAEVMKNQKLREEATKDIHKFEDLVHKEYGKLRKWEKAHIEKKLEKVI